MATALQQESRVKKTLMNARVNLIFYFIQLIISFFSRKIFLDSLGTDFFGLTGTLSNLLSFLNLAELGIGSAIGYLLYQPLYDHDEIKINEIISVMGYIYKWIGIIILSGGLILGGFLPLIFPDRDTHLTLPLIFFTYFSFLGSSLIGYFVNYRQILLGADQKNYVVTIYFQTINVFKILIQIFVAYKTRNCFLWVFIEFIFGILFSFILNYKINKTYPWLKSEIKLGKKLFKKYPEVVIKTKQLFIHKIGAFVQFQTTPFLIYTFSSLSLVAFYQNYTIVTTRVGNFFSNIFTGIGASIGNLIAEGNKDRILSVFWELFSLRFFIGGLICIPIYLLIKSFITIWLGSEYILSNFTLILILIPIFIGSVRSTVEDYNFGYGLFWDVWSPVVEIVILLGTSITLGYYYGLNGVLLGPVTSLILVILLWKPYMLFHWGIKTNYFLYWINFFKNSICIVLSFIPTYFIFQLFDWSLVNNFFEWILRASVIFLLYLVISYLLFTLFTNGMKDFNKRIKSIICQFIR